MITLFILQRKKRIVTHAERYDITFVNKPTESIAHWSSNLNKNVQNILLGESVKFIPDVEGEHITKGFEMLISKARVPKLLYLHRAYATYTVIENTIQKKYRPSTESQEQVFTIGDKHPLNVIERIIPFEPIKGVLFPTCCKILNGGDY